MSYTTTSQLEREARSKGDPLIWQQFFRSYVDSDANVRDKCYLILNERPEGSKQAALEKLVEKGGVWLEHDAPKRIFHVHGVMLSPKHGQPQEAYTLSWAQERLTELEEGAHGYHNVDEFNQERATEVLLSHQHPSGLKLVVPTAPERDATVRALIRAREVSRRQPELIDYVSQLIRSDYDTLSLTSDRVIYAEKGKFIRAFGREDREEIPVDLRSNPTQMIDFQISQSRLKLFLDTDESIAQVNDRYCSFLDIPNATYLWGSEGACERAVGLLRGATGLVIVGVVDIDHSMPVRACSRTKITLGGAP